MVGRMISKTAKRSLNLESIFSVNVCMHANQFQPVQTSFREVINDTHTPIIIYTTCSLSTIFMTGHTVCMECAYKICRWIFITCLDLSIMNKVLLVGKIIKTVTRWNDRLINILIKVYECRSMSIIQRCSGPMRWTTHLTFEFGFISNISSNKDLKIVRWWLVQNYGTNHQTNDCLVQTNGQIIVAWHKEIINKISFKKFALYNKSLKLITQNYSTKAAIYKEYQRTLQMAII